MSRDRFSQHMGREKSIMDFKTEILRDAQIFLSQQDDEAAALYEYFKGGEWGVKN